MKTLITKSACAFLTSVFLFSACKKYDQDPNIQPVPPEINQNAATNLSGNNLGNQAKDDTAELLRLIRVPFTPEESVWREEPVRKTTDGKNTAVEGQKKLIVVLRFNEEEAGAIVRQAEPYKPTERVNIDAETWFPAELIAKSGLSGDDTLKGTAYDAADFTQPPYANGRVTRIDDTNYFVLELFAP